MSIIFFIIIIFLFVVMFASSVIFSVIRWVLSLLGLGARTTRRAAGGEYGSGSRGSRYSSDDNGQRRQNSSTGNGAQWHFSPEEEYKRKQRKKIISPDEGEYVDYEEIK